MKRQASIVLLILMVELFCQTILCKASDTQDSWIHIRKVAPDQFIEGYVYGLSHPEIYSVVLYVWANPYHWEYPIINQESKRLSAPIDANEDWFLSLHETEPLETAFAVLIVETSEIEALPTHVETLHEISHYGMQIFYPHPFYIHETWSDTSEKLARAGLTFTLYESLIAGFFQELAQQSRSGIPSNDHARVLIVKNVQRPGIYEVEKRFTFSSVLEAAGGYGKRGTSKEYPYSVIIVRQITTTPQVYTFLYRTWRQNPDREEFVLEDGDIIYFPVMM